MIIASAVAPRLLPCDHLPRMRREILRSWNTQVKDSRELDGQTQKKQRRFRHRIRWFLKSGQQQKQAMQRSALPRKVLDVRVASRVQIPKLRTRVQANTGC